MQDLIEKKEMLLKWISIGKMDDYMNIEIKEGDEKMDSKDILKKIKKELENKKELSKEVFREIVQGIFIKYMGYENNTQIYYDDKNGKPYECIIDGKIIIGGYRNEIRTRALSLFSTYIKSKYEWGILIHPEGIWIVNDSIELGVDEFRSNKIVFELPFNKKMDINYFKYLTYENLLEDKNTYFFSDIINYKNKVYKGSEKSWSAYHTALKRFFDVYITNCGKYEPDKYDAIDIQSFGRYIKEKELIKSSKTRRNQFYYIKDFMIHQKTDSPFNIGAKEMEEKISGTLTGKSKELENMDMKKLNVLLNNTIKGKNALRNKTMILLLVSFGMTRREICSLNWEENISENCDGLYYDKRDKEEGKRKIAFPTLLIKTMRELKDSIPGNAKYVFGNSMTEYQIPMQEQRINEILAALNTKNKKDEFYKLLTTGNIRKWLFRHLMKNGYSLQYIMTLMDLPVTSLLNYISDEEIKESAFEKIPSGHPLEKFWEEIEIKG